jgi:phosphatidylcholine synthase
MTPWIAHVYTGLGAAIALAATLDILDGDYRRAFLWLALQIAIDATDGILARKLRVKERLPGFDGARLDDIIDYLTYVFVPMLLLLHADLLPSSGGPWIAAAVLMASGYGFSQTAAKVHTATEYFFTGFPSYWNLVALYLFLWRLPAVVNGAILLLFAVLVFLPVRYVYPTRTRTLQHVTTTLGLAWAAVTLWLVWRLPAVDGPWMWLSLVFPAYYFVLSFWLDRRSRMHEGA